MIDRNKKISDFLGKLVAPQIGCFSCKEPFTEKNVFTVEGWRETEISGMCEKCFDELFTEEE